MSEIRLGIRPRWKRALRALPAWRDFYRVFRKQHGRWQAAHYAVVFTWRMIWLKVTE